MISYEVMTASTAQVWKEFSDRLRRFIRKRVGHAHDADDILQEVASKIHSGLGRVENPGKLEAWIFQVARRTIIDHFRAHSPKRQPLELPAELAEDPTPGTTAEVASCLRPLMDSLAAEDREALLLTDVEGVSQKDLAARLGLSPSGAKSRVQRARKRLKGLLLECCHIEVDRRGNALSYTPRHGSCDSCSGE